MYFSNATDCNFTQNSAQRGGGALYYSYATNCYFAQNSAQHGGAMAWGNATKCTFLMNTAEEEGTDDIDMTNTDDDCTFILPILKASSLNTTYGNKDKLDFNLTSAGEAYNDINAIISISKNGTFVANYTALTGQGWVIDLPAGKYIAILTIPNSKVLPAYISINVAKVSTNISASDVSTIYNEDEYLVVNLTDGKGMPLSGVEVSITLDSAKTYTSDENGQIKINVANLAPKAYVANISFAGNDNYMGSSASAKVTVNKISTKITASAVSAIYNKNKYLVVKLTDVSGKALGGVKVKVSLGSAKTYTTDKNGQIKINVCKLVPKTYTAKISFAGNNIYSASSKAVKVTVKKAAVKMTAKAKTFKVKVKTKKYTIALKNNLNKVMKNTKVTLRVNKKTFSAKTNSKGVATFKIINLKKKGKFTATIKYAGSKYYKALSKKAKITVKK